jgi:molecular chaperone Hsp33
MGKVLIAMDKSGSFRVHLTITTDMCREASHIHDTTPVATAGLGRVLTGTALMSSMLGEPDNKLTVQFKGDGPAKQILACADGNGNVKGYIADPNVDLPLKNGKLDVGGSLGIGELTVIRDLGLGEPYSGTIALVSGEIAEDLAAYYFISEQMNTSVALGVKVGEDLEVMVAGGMFVQMLPGAQDGAVDALEKLLGEMPPITTSAEKAILRSAGKSEEGVLEIMLNDIFSELPEEYELQIMGSKDVRWNCDCSRERMKSALATIGKNDLRQIIDEDGQAELCCNFCNTKYRFDRKELEEIYEKM